jgi:hypothetical protein
MLVVCCTVNSCGGADTLVSRIRHVAGDREPKRYRTERVEYVRSWIRPIAGTQSGQGEIPDALYPGEVLRWEIEELGR